LRTYCQRTIYAIPGEKKSKSERGVAVGNDGNKDTERHTLEKGDTQVIFSINGQKGGGEPQGGDWCGGSKSAGAGERGSWRKVELHGARASE